MAPTETKKLTTKNSSKNRAVRIYTLLSSKRVPLLKKREKMDTGEIIGIGLGGASAVGQAMYGQQQAQQNQQQQVQDQKELMELGNNLAYKNWLRTNYSGQVEQMKKAGLNVGMLYSKGGSGGTLTGGAAGSASKADTVPIDISNSISQNRAIESQIKVNEAQEMKIKEEAKGIAYDNQVKGEGSVQSNILEAQNKTIKALQEYYTTLGGDEDYNNGNNKPNTAYQDKLINELTIIEEGARQEEAETRIKEVEARIKEATEEEEKGLIKQGLINAVIEGRLKEANIELSQEQKNKIWHDIWQGWTNAGFNGLGKISNMMFMKNITNKK